MLSGESSLYNDISVQRAVRSTEIPAFWNLGIPLRMRAKVTLLQVLFLSATRGLGLAHAKYSLIYEGRGQRSLPLGSLATVTGDEALQALQTREMG